MKYQICKKSVMDTTYPGIEFDKNGISNHFYDFQKNVKKNLHTNSNGQNHLEKYIESIKKNNKNNDFDCILGLSGGMDSSYMLHKVVKDYQLRPLVFHVDGGWNSEQSVHNIHSLVNKLNLDLYTEVINWDEMRDFQLSFFKSGVPHIDIPQDHAFIAVLYKFATKYNIKNILNGGNIATESVIMPYKYYYWGTDMRQIRDIRKKNGESEMKSYPFSSVFNHKIYLRYLRGIKVFKPLNYLTYNKKAAEDELKINYGWKPYSQKHFESRFTKFYEGYWLPKRFNFDVRRCQLSSLIFSNQISRNDALEILSNNPMSVIEQKNEIEYVAAKLDITLDQLNEFLIMPKKFYWDYKNYHLILKYTEKLMQIMNLGRRGGAF
tara:strand:+ start:18507 stop:19640 length:1134 start_codon:yes stop_codon:yes gene_type:complete